MNRKLSEPERERAARLVALISVLIHAWRTNNFAEAGNAQSELAKAGIRVQLPRRTASIEAAESSATTATTTEAAHG